MNALVSIIVPIYNVSKYIKDSSRSLLDQSYENIEYIFVDDCTPDNSITILENVLLDYPNRINNVKIIRHTENQGLPAARNSGLSKVTGDYIFHCDSDDWIEATMIADMIQNIENNAADIVYSDYFLTFHKNERYMKQPKCINADNCIRSMLTGKMKFNVWNKLIKSELYFKYNIRFPDGRSMGEDMTIFKLFCHAKKVNYLPKAYYHYIQTNPNAFTKQMSPKQLEDIQYNLAHLIEYLTNIYGSKKFEDACLFFKLNMKLPFLISMDKKLYDLWRAWFPEANSKISSNPDFSFRIKLLQYAALNRQDWFVKLYNLIIVKFIYGIIYK